MLFAPAAVDAAAAEGRRCLFVADRPAAVAAVIAYAEAAAVELMEVEVEAAVVVAVEVLAAEVEVEVAAVSGNSHVSVAAHVGLEVHPLHLSHSSLKDVLKHKI